MELRLWRIKDLWPAVLLVLHQSGVAVEVCGEEATRRGGCRRFRPALHNIKSCGRALPSPLRRGVRERGRRRRAGREGGREAGGAATSGGREGGAAGAGRCRPGGRVWACGGGRGGGMVVAAAGGTVGGRAWQRGLGRQARRGGGRLVRPRWPEARGGQGQGAGGWQVGGGSGSGRMEADLGFVALWVSWAFNGLLG
jgi:hypothetical protein